MGRPTFTEVGMPLTEKEFAAAEAALGVKFPEQYRRFLLHTNGGHPTPHCFGDFPVNMFCGIGRTGPDDLIHYHSIASEAGLPADILAIGYGSVGFDICIGIRGDRQGKIYVYDPEFDSLKWIADDFDAFLDSFYEPDLSDLADDDDADDGDEESRNA